MTAYYNEIDPFAAQWLRNLIRAGHIAPGVVDTRSILDVRPSDLRGFTQCHFFAGIGVWSLALRRAGWRDDRPVWTGSCPCQPFSSAGRGDGMDDKRHLWPHWHYLIEQRRPPVLFGEQVASKDAEPWLDLVRADMEGLGAAFGALAFPAAGIGAPHLRDRTYWTAILGALGYSGSAGLPTRQCGAVVGAWWGLERRAAEQPGGALGGVADLHRDGCEPGCEGREALGHRPAAEPDRGAGVLALTGHGGCSGLHDARPAGPTHGVWGAADWLFCRDGRWRPVEPGTFPLAHGVAGRVGQLRAYGNAIVAPQAQEWIETVMECMPC